MYGMLRRQRGCKQGDVRRACEEEEYGGCGRESDAVGRDRHKADTRSLSPPIAYFSVFYDPTSKNTSPRDFPLHVHWGAKFQDKFNLKVHHRPTRPHVRRTWSSSPNLFTTSLVYVGPFQFSSLRPLFPILAAGPALFHPVAQLSSTQSPPYSSISHCDRFYSSKRKVKKMPPKKKEEEKKILLGRPGNNLKSGIVCMRPHRRCGRPAAHPTLAGRTSQRGQVYALSGYH